MNTSAKHRIVTSLSPGRTRWAMLVVTVVMGAALIAAALTSFVSAHQASKMVTEVVGAKLMRAAFLEIQAGGEEQVEQSLAVVMEEQSDDGLRYLGLYSRDGATIAEIGERSAQPLEMPERGFAGRVQGPPRAQRVGAHGRLRIITPAMRGRRGMHPVPGLMPHSGMRGTFLVLEYEPVKAHRISLRAGRSLLASLIGAVILLVAAGIVWRLSVRSARVEAQLARDRQLLVLGQMSAVLGHELRNPLASLKGHAQILLERLGEQDPLREGAGIIVSEAKRLEDLTLQVLDFARTGEIARTLVPVMEMVRSASERSNAAPVMLEAQGEIPEWSLDRPRIEQVLENLLINARQNSPEDQPVIVTVRADRGNLQILVRDRGDGIAEGDEERIFEPFFTKRVRGTGLGLALARRIVEQHAGQISTSNHPEGGALFEVNLPHVTDPG